MATPIQPDIPLVMTSASLAPMEGVTGFAMRFWLHLASRPSAMTTPFLRVTAGQPAAGVPASFAPELFELRGLLGYELTPQFITSDDSHFLRVAAQLPPPIAPVIEINCGCPSPTALGPNAGSGALRDAAAFGRMLLRLTTALGPGRLAVKMRLGMADDAEFDQLLPEVAALPLARLTVHGRTRADGYRGEARWQRVEQAARATKVLTIGSGDIVDIVTATQAQQVAPAAGGVMIGRGALRNPWIFEELRLGLPVRMQPSVLANALLAFALFTELWISAPEKLLRLISNRRLPEYCGTNADAWEALVARLTTLTFGSPTVLRQGTIPPPLAVSPQAFSRVRYLWQYLQTGTALPRRCHSLNDILTTLLASDA